MSRVSLTLVREWVVPYEDEIDMPEGTIEARSTYPYVWYNPELDRTYYIQESREGWWVQEWSGPLTPCCLDIAIEYGRL